jgi:hypothetical protein
MFELLFVGAFFAIVVANLVANADSASDRPSPFSDNGFGKFTSNTDDMFSTMTSMDHSSDPMKPIVNIDGTPMFGDMDAHGNPFGVTSSWDSGISSMGSDSMGHSSSSMFD